MNKNKLIAQWQKEICDHIDEYHPYQLDLKLDRMINLFTPGKFYYYVVNFHNLKMEVVHPNTSDILNIPSSQFTTEKFLEVFDSKELQKFQEKEAYVADFLFNYLSPEELPFYKVSYFLTINSKDGTKKTLLHQATTLSVSDTGKVEHVLGIHTEVSHIKFIDLETVSFIHLNGGESFYNCDYKQRKFNKKHARNTKSFAGLLTKSELAILQLIAQGESSKAISSILNISRHTVDTHRRNILEKTATNNLNHLIADLIIQGLITL